MRNKRVVEATDELGKLINNMADSGGFPVLSKWLSGDASGDEIEQAHNIIKGQRTKIAQKYGLREEDLEKERDKRNKDALGE